MAGAEAVATARARSELGTRVLVGVAAGIVAIGAVWLGGALLWALLTAVALVALIEWGALVGAGRLALALALVVLAGGLASAAPGMWGTDRSSVALLLIAALLLAMVPRCGAVALGIAYVGLAAIALLYLRDQPRGVLLALWTLAIVWATDIGAYFAGRAIGGPKLAPAISPAKTWAGLIGGMVAAGAVGALIGAAGHLPVATWWLGAPLAVVAQAGDLAESALKRRAGVKDSGRLLPGHGGVLDRVDGLLPVATLVAAIAANGSL